MNGFEKELRDKVLGFTSHVTVYKNPTSENYDLSEFKNLKNKNKILGYSPYIERESLISSNISSTNAMAKSREELCSSASWWRALLVWSRCWHQGW